MSDDMTYVKLFTSLHHCGSIYMIQIELFRDLSSLLITQRTMESKILGEVEVLFNYVTYCQLACFRHLWLDSKTFLLRFSRK